MPLGFIAIRRTSVAKCRSGQSELKARNNWQIGRPETELDFKLHRQAATKIMGIQEKTAIFLQI